MAQEPRKSPLLTAVLPADRRVGAMGDDGAKHHVLVAEDDKGLRESLVRVLRFEGYDVEAVGDGAKALEAVDVRVPDAVVLDVMMPVVDGLTACRRLRERHRLLPILMLTTESRVDKVERAKKAGAKAWIIKPFKPELLVEAVGKLTALPESPSRIPSP